MGILVRMPRYIRDEINMIAHRRHMSTNTWCMHAITMQLDVELQAEARRKASR